MYIVTMAARISQSVEERDDWKAIAAPWNCVWILAGMPISISVSAMASTASESDAPLARLKETRNRGTAGRPDVDAPDGGRVEPVVRLDFEHDAVLVRLGVNGRNEPLAEGVIKSVRDVRRRHAQPGSGIAVDVDVSLQAVFLQVAGDVGQLGDLP